MSRHRYVGQLGSSERRCIAPCCGAATADAVYTHDRDESLAAELALLREAAHRHVAMGHHERCDMSAYLRRGLEFHPCTCGFDEACQALKEYGR